MTASRKITFLGLGALALCAFAGAANAQGVVHMSSDNPKSVIDQAVTVPPGYTTYYISGTPASPLNADAVKKGAAPVWGDTAQQASSSLDKLGATLKKLGLTFGDVVKATVFLVPDPHNGGKLNFAAMNKEFGKRFGTPSQPHKPARSTIQVVLATPGALCEIELIAVKKVK
jgi:enamine deaminase RidA (YjgF/YER057c/UK114 family)